MEFVLIFSELYPDGLIVDSHQFDTYLKDCLEPYATWAYIDKKMVSSTIESCPEITVRVSRVKAKAANHG